MHIPPDDLRQCRVLAGPTAVGKSELSLRLAEALDAEILSLDSMAIYRRMDIGTAKPSADDRQRVPHHLIDLIEPDQDFSLAEYVTEAARVVREVLARGRVPLFVGGTGLYLRGILRGVFPGPPADWDLRRELETIDRDRPGELLRELNRVDPVSADRLHPNDRRRIIRAVEVYRLTGVPLSSQQRQEPTPESDRPHSVVWLAPPRDWLHERIERRVDRMLADGLVTEVRELLNSPHPPSRTARQGLGYKEIIDFLEGTVTEDEAITNLKTRTRQFAKRQETWFRNLVECREVLVSPDDTPSDLLHRVICSD